MVVLVVPDSCQLHQQPPPVPMQFTGNDFMTLCTRMSPNSSSFWCSVTPNRPELASVHWNRKPVMKTHSILRRDLESLKQLQCGQLLLFKHSTCLGTFPRGQPSVSTYSQNLIQIELLHPEVHYQAMLATPHQYAQAQCAQARCPSGWFPHCTILPCVNRRQRTPISLYIN